MSDIDDRLAALLQMAQGLANDQRPGTPLRLPPEIRAELLALSMVRAQHDPGIHRPNPNGSEPVCVPKLGPDPTCERCGGSIETARGPCPAVPPEMRWGPDVEQSEGGR